MKTLSRKLRAGVLFLLLTVFLAPQFALAQFGPPAGLDNMMPPTGIPEDSGQFGPPAGVDEVMNKGAEMEKKGLEQMKKSVGSMRKAISQMEKAIAGVKKAGYSVSQDIITATNKAKLAIDTIEQAASFAEAETALDDFNAFIDILDANIEVLNMLANFPRILKQADKTMTQLEKMFAKEKTKALKSAIDLQTVIDDIQAKIDSLKTAKQKAETAAKAGQASEAFEILEMDYFEKIEETFQSVGMLQAASNLSRAASSIKKGIAQAEKITTKLQKKGVDVSEAKSIIEQSKNKLAEFQALIKVKPLDPEAAVDILEELEDLRTAFENSIETATGDNLHGSETINFFNTKVPALPKELKNGFPEGEAGDSGFEKMEF